MGWFANIQKRLAKKIIDRFIDPVTIADHAIDDLAEAEKALEEAKVKAAESTQHAHEALLANLAEAQAEVVRLVAAAQAAEDKARAYSGKVLALAAPQVVEAQVIEVPAEESIKQENQ